ncbi:oligo-beta-mannoside permease IIC protein, partial [Klebsiella pneumoniae]|nr:oligo-beta-mannoside permease IIC protein [Klebsiella pneumoniae]
MSHTRWIERDVMPAALRLAGQTHVLSGRDGLSLTLPFRWSGSVFLLCAYRPLPGYADR